MIIKENWRLIALPEHASLKEVGDSFQKSGLGLVIIASEYAHLKGIITDGDLRRAFVDGRSLNSRASEIMNSEPVTYSGSTDVTVIEEFCYQHGLTQLPLLDDSGKLTGFAVSRVGDERSSFENVMVIMAGGLGTRLGKLTQDCPKPMLKIKGKPMLEHIILKAKAEGFRNFIISVRYLGHIIEAHFGDGASLGVAINYIKEDGALGTAGALGLLDPIPSLPLVVTNGDVLTEFNYARLLAYHLNHDGEATMAVRAHQIQNPFGVVEVEGSRIVGFSEKPVYESIVNAGMYVLDPIVMTLIKKNSHLDMPSVFERAIDANFSTRVCFVDESWIDIGSPSDIAAARA